MFSEFKKVAQEAENYLLIRKHIREDLVSEGTHVKCVCFNNSVEKWSSCYLSA